MVKKKDLRFFPQNNRQNMKKIHRPNWLHIYRSPKQSFINDFDLKMANFIKYKYFNHLTL